MRNPNRQRAARAPMEPVRSFDPVSDPNAQLLILGSMPGRASLEAAEYYAYPRNAFWKIMESLFGIPAAAPYAERLRRLRSNHIALWDVMKACRRASSLDSDIVEASIVPNDFASFFAAHPRIVRVFFNGAKAEAAYRKHVVAAPDDRGSIAYARLPSTSPAHASLSLQQKISRWNEIVR